MKTEKKLTINKLQEGDIITKITKDNNSLFFGKSEDDIIINKSYYLGKDKNTDKHIFILNDQQNFNYDYFYNNPLNKEFAVRLLIKETDIKRTNLLFPEIKNIIIKINNKLEGILEYYDFKEGSISRTGTIKEFIELGIPFKELRDIMGDYQNPNSEIKYELSCYFAIFLDETDVQKHNFYKEVDEQTYFDNYSKNFYNN